MNATAAARLAAKLDGKRDMICKRVTVRLLATFPELKQVLHLEGGIAAEDRLNQTATDRLCELVRAILLFESLSLADQEFRWAGGVLPRYGVRYQHQSSMVRWFFEEFVRLGLDEEEMRLVGEIEQYILSIVKSVYKV